jgi:hypothetical protein
MPPPTPIERLRALQESMGWIPLVIFDVGWGRVAKYRDASDEFRRIAEEVGIAYQRHTSSSSKSVRKSVRRFLAEPRADGTTLVILNAKTTREWESRHREIVEIVGATAKVTVMLGIVPDTVDPLDSMVSQLIEHLASRTPASPVQERQVELLRDRVQRLMGIEHPIVVVVCGNETQQQAQAEFPSRLLTEMGLEGIWYLTDYDRPERVVDEIKNLCERSRDAGGRSRVVLVLFSQLFNATNVKRDGQEALRALNIPSFTPNFKSLGSALREVATHMERILPPCSRAGAGETDE